MFALLLIIAVLLLLILIQLFYVAGDIRSLINRSLPALHESIVTQASHVELEGVVKTRHFPPPHPHGNGLECVGYLVTWIWCSGKWVHDLLPPGCEPGLPPAHAGAFENDKVQCWRAAGE